MKIAIICPSLLPVPATLGGAIETLINNLLSENERIGNLDITVFSIYNNDSFNHSQEYRKAKFEFYNYGFADRLYTKFWNAVYLVSKKRIASKSFLVKRALNRIKSDGFDYLLVEGNIHQVIQLKQLNIPIILHMHTDILNASEPLTKRVVKYCSKVLVISNFLKSRIAECGCNVSNVLVYKNCINTQAFNLKKDIGLKQSLGIPEDNKILIFCGRVDKIKGVEQLVLAYQKANLKSTSLLIVGGSKFADSKVSDYEEHVKAIVKSNNLDVHFTGYIPQSELPQYYSIADYAICPSICNEAAGLVIIEATCSGLPVVASNIGGIPEYTNPNTSILVDVNESFIDNLAMAIKKVVSANSYNKEEFNVYREKFELNNYYLSFIKNISI